MCNQFQESYCEFGRFNGSQSLSQLFSPRYDANLMCDCPYAMHLGVQVRQTQLADGDFKKELVRRRFTLRHHHIASILAALMVMGTIGGITIIYFNNSKIAI